MPLPNEYNPFTQKPEPPVYEIKIAPEEYKHAIVNSAEIPIDSLIMQLDGMPVKLDYYSQVLGKHDEIEDYNSTYNGPDQQYHLIKNVEMKLQAPLASSFADEENRVTITGSAITYPGLKANVGDIIILDIGDGRAGLFTVNFVAQKSIYKNAVYEIEFTLKDILTKSIEDRLNSNVVETSYFEKDFLTYGQNPVISSNTAQVKNQIQSAITQVLGSWVIEFYSYQIQTIRVPTRQGVVFDPFIVNMMINTFGSRAHPLLAEVNNYNCGQEALSGYLDIWNAILKGESYILKTAFTKYKLVSARAGLDGNVYLRPVRFSGITHILLPHVAKESIQDPLNVFKYPLGDLLVDIDPLTPEQIEARLEAGISAPQIAGDRNYVISANSYKMDGAGGSPLEQQLINYFKNSPVNHSTILKYVDNRDLLSPLERFYLMPLCLLMLIHCLRSL